LTTGTCVRLHGILVDSIGKEQTKELQVNEVEILGECDSVSKMFGIKYIFL
jgi:asparaginyl-tRNA synthetase